LELGTFLLLVGLLGLIWDAFFIMSGKYIEKWELASEISLVIGNGALISSFLYFGYAHVTADYSFVNVSTNVSNDMDFMLRVSAIWSGQAGSYLFWAFSISVF
jgi:cytochrome c biogenesis factor